MYRQTSALYSQTFNLAHLDSTLGMSPLEHKYCEKYSKEINLIVLYVANTCIKIIVFCLEIESK